MVSFREYIRAYLDVLYRRAFGLDGAALPSLSGAVSLLRRTMHAHGIYVSELSEVSVRAVYPGYDAVYYRVLFRRLAEQFVQSGDREYSAPDIATSQDSAQRLVPIELVVPQESYPAGLTVDWRTVHLPVGVV